MAQLSLGLSKAILMLGTTPAQKVFLGTVQVWANEIVVVLANRNDLVMKTLFATADWSGNTPKRVVVPVGVEIGSTQNAYAIATTITADGQAGSFGGTLTLEVRGTVSGIGGAANSGVGGSVILANFPGKNGQKLKVNVIGGTLRAGGGGGGRGGDGGSGNYASAYTYQEGPSYSRNSYCWRSGGGTDGFYWGGSFVLSTTSSSGSAGGWNYYASSFAEKTGGGLNGAVVNYYYVYRTQTRYNYPATVGGIAGNAGRGQGCDGALTSGAAAVAGGTNAGASGKSGDGAAYGATGQAGTNGAAGNVGAGLAGATGGLAGFYISGIAYVDLINGGTLLGRVN